MAVKTILICDRDGTEIADASQASTVTITSKDPDARVTQTATICATCAAEIAGSMEMESRAKRGRRPAAQDNGGGEEAEEDAAE